MGKVGVGGHDMWQYIKKERKSLQHLVWVILNLNSLLVKRQVDNPSPGAVTGGN